MDVICFTKPVGLVRNSLGKMQPWSWRSAGSQHTPLPVLVTFFFLFKGFMFSCWLRVGVECSFQWFIQKNPTSPPVIQEEACWLSGGLGGLAKVVWVGQASLQWESCSISGFHWGMSQTASFSIHFCSDPFRLTHQWEGAVITSE